MLFNLWARSSYFLNDFSLYLILISLSLLITVVAVILIFKSNLKIIRKKILISAALTILTLILTYSLFEAYFRYVYDASDGLGFLKINERWHNRHVVYNSDFFRDRNFDVNKKPGVARIGVLGDSITFGGGIENVNDRFSNILEKKLRAANFSVEVYNLGKPGYDTEGEIQVYDSVKHLNFDIIIWQYFLNDIQALGKSTGTPIIVKNSKTGKTVQFLSEKSFFFDFLYWRTSSKYNKTLGELRNADLERYKDADQLKTHQDQITSFLKDLKSENKKVVVIIFPFLYFLGPNYPAQDVHQIMSKHFSENGAQVIDLLDYLKGYTGRDLWASRFDSHPNEYVHQVTAQKLYERLIDLIKQ